MAEKKVEDLLEKVPEKVEPKADGKVLLAGSATFPCPKCGETSIVRSFHEREIATKYVCTACNFEGPN